MHPVLILGIPRTFRYVDTCAGDHQRIKEVAVALEEGNDNL